MSDKNKVVWSEGLFLRPQHFQQHDRYLEALVEGRVRAIRSDTWGFSALQLETDHLGIGRIGVKSAEGVFPDGTPFRIPDDCPPPPPLSIDEKTRDTTVMLALPLRGSDRAEVVRDDAADSLARYRITDEETFDSTGQRDNSATVETGVLRTRLLLSSAPTGEYAAIPLAHVIERRADGQIVLDEQFMPSVLSCRASGRLWSFVGELLGTMRQRAHELSGRVTASGRGGAAEISDFLMLQAINRFEPAVAHFARATHTHPLDLYLLAAQLAGELATFTTDSKRCEEFPIYQQENLRKSFDPVIRALRLAFGAQLQQVAVPITVGQIRNRPGFFGAPVSDPGLFIGSSFVLAVRADVPHEDLRRNFPLQAKIGSPDQIQSLVSTAVPGITLNALPVAPRQIPYHAGFVYFELDGNQRIDLWERCRTQTSFAFHVGGNWPGLKMEFWAIRG